MSKVVSSCLFDDALSCGWDTTPGSCPFPPLLPSPFLLSPPPLPLPSFQSVFISMESPEKAPRLLSYGQCHVIMGGPLIINGGPLTLEIGPPDTYY